MILTMPFLSEEASDVCFMVLCISKVTPQLDSKLDKIRQTFTVKHFETLNQSSEGQIIRKKPS